MRTTPSIAVAFMREKFMGRLKTLQKGEPGYDLYLGSLNPQKCRMHVEIEPIFPHISIPFKPRDAYFLPGEEGYKHYEKLAKNKQSVLKVAKTKSRNQVVCMVEARFETAHAKMTVGILFPSQAIHKLERELFEDKTRMPAKKGKSALEKTL